MANGQIELSIEKILHSIFNPNLGSSRSIELYMEDFERISRHPNNSIPKSLSNRLLLDFLARELIDTTGSSEYNLKVAICQAMGWEVDDFKHTSQRKEGETVCLDYDNIIEVCFSEVEPNIKTCKQLFDRIIQDDNEQPKRNVGLLGHLIGQCDPLDPNDLIIVDYIFSDQNLLSRIDQNKGLIPAMFFFTKLDIHLDIHREFLLNNIQRTIGEEATLGRYFGICQPIHFFEFLSDLHKLKDSDIEGSKVSPLEILKKLFISESYRLPFEPLTYFLNPSNIESFENLNEMWVSYVLGDKRGEGTLGLDIKDPFDSELIANIWESNKNFVLSFRHLNVAERTMDLLESIKTDLLSEKFSETPVTKNQIRMVKAIICSQNILELCHPDEMEQDHGMFRNGKFEEPKILHSNQVDRVLAFLQDLSQSMDTNLQEWSAEGLGRIERAGLINEISNDREQYP